MFFYLTRKTTDRTPFKITETKSYKRYIEKIASELIVYLNDYIKWKRGNSISKKFLFGGDRPLTENAVRRYLDRAVLSANHNLTSNDKTEIKRITPHGFRRNYASLLAHVGYATKTVVALIGDTEEMVIQTYSHLYKDATEQAIDKLEELLNK